MDAMKEAFEGLTKTALAIKDERDSLSVEVERLRDLLLYEASLRVSIKAPWKCTEPDCPCLGKPMRKECGCFTERMGKHSREVSASIGRKA